MSARIDFSERASQSSAPIQLKCLLAGRVVPREMCHKKCPADLLEAVTCTSLDFNPFLRVHTTLPGYFLAGIYRVSPQENPKYCRAGLSKSHPQFTHSRL